MTDRTILRQLIDTLPDSQLDAAEEALTYLQQEKARQTMRELARVPRYDTDFYAWVWTQAAALRAQNWTGLDLEHLVEEIESLGIADEHAITRQLQRLLLHLLKWRYQPTHRTPSWRRTIRGSVANFDFGAKSENRVSIIQ